MFALVRFENRYKKVKLQEWKLGSLKSAFRLLGVKDASIKAAHEENYVTFKRLVTVRGKDCFVEIESDDDLDEEDDIRVVLTPITRVSFFFLIHVFISRFFGPLFR